MRFGARILFEDVTTTFLAGTALRDHRPQWLGQIDVHENPDR